MNECGLKNWFKVSNFKEYSNIEFNSKHFMSVILLQTEMSCTHRTNQGKPGDLERDFRRVFSEKVKSWFRNKGIVNKLELYLKSQMIIEFQRSCGQSIPSENTTLSPKVQAVKVLIADFLLQENLLFSLSVYCTEIPFLLNLSRYNQYVSHLAQPTTTALIGASKASKPKFCKEELHDLLDALHLNVKTDEFAILYDSYVSGKSSSLLVCLLSRIPTLMKKYRALEYVMKKTRRKETLLRKLLKIEKSKVRNMYSVVQSAYGAVEKHKSDMQQLIHDQKEIKENLMISEIELSELTKKKSELETWHKTLELKEHTLKETYRNKLHELENRAKALEKKEFELLSKYQMLQEEKAELKIDKDRIEHATLHIQLPRVDESDKLQEFEKKFRDLQVEVRNMLRTYNERRKQTYDNLKPLEKSVQNENTEEILYSMEEYINLIEKENSLLKFSSSKQCNNMCQLRNEITFLKSRLDNLEKEIKFYKRTELDFHQKETFCHSETERKPRTATPLSKRKLFHEHETMKLNEFSSSGTSREINLTDEIVADAKSKVKDLENESETLNRNFRSLQNILTRNIALSESKILGSISVIGSSPRFSQLSRSYSDLDSPNVSTDVRKYLLSSSVENATSSDTNHEFGVNSPKITSTPSTKGKSSPFRELFLKRKKEKKNTDYETVSRDEAEELLSSSSSPREKIDSNVRVAVHPVKQSTSILTRAPDCIN